MYAVVYRFGGVVGVNVLLGRWIRGSMWEHDVWCTAFVMGPSLDLGLSRTSPKMQIIASE